MAEPRDQHDALCDIWLSDDPADACTCRDDAGKTTDLADERLAARRAAETAWHDLTPCQRAEQYDTIAAKGA